MIIECLFFQLATWVLIEVTKGVSYELIVHFHEPFQSLFSSQLLFWFEPLAGDSTCSCLDEIEKKLLSEWLKEELICGVRCQRNPHTMRVVNVRSPKAAIWSGSNETPMLQHLNYWGSSAVGSHAHTHSHTHFCLVLSLSLSLSRTHTHTHTHTSLSQGKKGPFRWTVEYFWRFVLWTLPLSLPLPLSPLWD